METPCLASVASAWLSTLALFFVGFSAMFLVLAWQILRLLRRYQDPFQVLLASIRDRVPAVEKHVQDMKESLEKHAAEGEKTAKVVQELLTNFIVNPLAMSANWHSKSIRPATIGDYQKFQVWYECFSGWVGIQCNTDDEDLARKNFKRMWCQRGLFEFDRDQGRLILKARKGWNRAAQQTVNKFASRQIREAQLAAQNIAAKNK